MKELSGTATGRTRAPIEECYALLSDVESYPDWFPDGVRAAEALERDPASGEATKIKTTLHTSKGPGGDFKLHMAVTRQPPELVELRRLPHEQEDPERMTVTWHLTRGPETLIQLALAAQLDLPRFVPVGGVAQGLADQFMQAALRRLDGR
jgi:uncharacterized protein YndB with AHSA1/START domain